MRLEHKEYVCLANEDEVQAARKKYKNSDIGCGLILDPLWRQIRISGTHSVLFLELMSVNEETSQGGYWAAGYGCAKFGFAWEDLDDMEFLQKMVKHEQFAVAAKVLQILTALKAHRVSLQKKLAVTGPTKKKTSPDAH